MADAISNGVGVNQPNLESDVTIIQTLLNEHIDIIGAPLTVDGAYGPKTLAAITAYQSAVLKMPNPDGVISPNGETITSLSNADLALSAAAVPVPAMLSPQPMPPTELTDADFSTAAAALGCDVPSIKAVSTVETGPQGAFDSQGRPTILFERHLFHAATHGIYDASDPDISNPVQGGYGLFSAQYPKMIRAAALNFDAALASASWGKFQILGSNHIAAGFTGVEVYVAAMRSGVQAHLNAFVSFVLADHVKLTALQTHNWAGFAARYNGPGYAADGYDKRLAEAYAENGGA